MSSRHAVRAVFLTITRAEIPRHKNNQKQKRRLGLSPPQVVMAQAQGAGAARQGLYPGFFARAR